MKLMLFFTRALRAREGVHKNTEIAKTVRIHEFLPNEDTLMKSKKIFGLLLIIAMSGSSQWSKSPYTTDALFACPGFSSRIVSYPDGSSIIIGIGDNNEIWMQKLDPDGYKQWLPWISVFPSISGLRYFLPDDDGGIYAIIGTQAQRVDKNGNSRWGNNGKKIIPSGSLTKAITDGKNGFIGINNYFDSLQRIIVFRYDSTGKKLWERQIDSSSVQGSISGIIVGRLGKKTLIQTSKGACKLIDLEGNVANADATFLNSFIFAQETDTSAFNIQLRSFTQDSLGNLTILRIVKVIDDWDTSWTFNYERRDDSVQYLNIGDPFLPDGMGNLFHFSSYYDNSNSAFIRVRRISSNGFIGSEKGIVIKGLAGRYFFSSKAKLGFVTDFMNAQLIDTNGIKLWPDTFYVITDNNNSYFEEVTTDFNGGAIVSFWTVAGGIKVQHTGRDGKIGVLTKIKDELPATPSALEVFQNFPNPFNPVTKLSYRLPRSGATRLTVYDLLGRVVTTLVDEHQTPGEYAVDFNGSSLSSGLYLYRLTSGEFTAQRTMMLIK
ncbi:MAG: T9SS type A sorting domain-containing protein [Bacteroidetes bacterium]|nr:T9SS type A sorting domain-containing protein [Bacteroidota bacterium]